MSFRLSRHPGATRQRECRTADHFRYVDLSLLIPLEQHTRAQNALISTVKRAYAGNPSTMLSELSFVRPRAYSSGQGEIGVVTGTHHAASSQAIMT